MSPDWLRDVRFLIIDDNQHMIRILHVLLQAFGARTIHEATDAIAAIDALKGRSVDIILVDQNMPVLTGIEFAKLIRQGSDSPNQFVPLTLVTAHTEHATILAARDAGINAVVRKPVSARELATRIRNVIVDDRPFVQTATYVGPHRAGVDPDPDDASPNERAA
jgi:CheY-like chemotaxis protein